MIAGLRLRRLVCMLALATAVLPAAAGADSSATRVYTMQPSSGNPEGVAFDPRSGFFYVSHVGTGAIYRGTLDDPVVHPLLPGGQDGRTSATGMKVDQEGRLYIAGAATGSFFVYDTATGMLLARFDTGAGGFLNDVALTKNGDLYVTDSLRPFLYRVRAATIEAGTGPVEAIPVAPEIQYGPGFNLNGLVATDDGKALISVQTNNGRLWRIEPFGDLLGRTITEIPVVGDTLRDGDGLVNDGGGLLVVRNGIQTGEEVVTELNLRRGGTAGEVVGKTSDDTFMNPTTAALARDRVLVVNSEFVHTNGPPYTVSSIKRP
jgi:Cu-Zn family superoxide dismutase